ncbi:MAG TPA: C40 family peptidase [Candidatus Saccharimonadales bacterium]|nr:C40 family peptidase [Candidatus Saccharimonadales bacterium]
MKKLVCTILLFLSFASIGHAQHYVTKGETMGKIAKANDMSLKDLINLNQHIKDPNKIRVGDYIVIRSKVETQKDLVDYARSLQSVTAYSYGGNNFPYSTDCSGWVQGVYRQFGVNLPRVSRDQAKTGQPVKFQDLQIGDLMFFSTRADKTITHVGIFMGENFWISNLNAKKDVQIFSTFGTWTQDHFLWGTRYKM